MKGLLILNVSMMLLVGGAKADDLWLTALQSPPAPSPAHDWSGFYAGGHLGVAWGNSNWTATTTGALMPSISGSLMVAYAFLQYRRLKTARREKRIDGPPPQPSLPAVRQAILELFAQSPPLRRCPHCRKWICNKPQRE